jgi:hypothetical protein
MREIDRIQAFENVANKIIKILNLFYVESDYREDKAYFCFDYYRLRFLSKNEFNNYIGYRLNTIQNYIFENGYSFIYKPYHFKDFIKFLKERIPSANDKFSSEKQEEIKDIILGEPKIDCPNCPYKDDVELSLKENYNFLCINCKKVN